MAAAISITLGARCAGKTTAVARARAIQVAELRACALCMHSAGEQPGTALACHNPDVRAMHGARTPCSVARQAGNACGPDAHHLDMQAWQAHRQQARP